MGFKINLKPYPAAEYFTVREHLLKKTATAFHFAKRKKQAGRKASIFI
jgi:hypothetical protein